MNIEIYENQTANVHITLQTEIPDFEVYGGTSKTQFTVSGEYTVEIPAQLVSGCSIPRYDIFARRKSNGREWPILTGKIFVNKRQSSVNGESVSPKDYYVTIPIVESGVQGKTLVVGIPGDSAYEVARLNGFEGTEAEWLEDMRQQTATLAVEQVTPFTERAEAGANKAEQEAQKSLESKQAAKLSETNAANAADNAASSKAAAGESARQAGEHKDAAEAAKLDAEQAKNDAQTHEQNAATASQNATQQATEAAKSASQAAADKAAAEKAKADAQAAQGKAEQEAAKAEQNAALLGDAALQGGNNTFSGENNLTGSLSLAGNPAQEAEEMAYWPVAVQAFMVQCYDWSQFKNDFGKLKKPWRFPKAMPEPEQIRTTANMRGWFNQGLTFTHLPASWTFEGLTTIFETFSNNSQLREFPAGVTFSNVSNFSFGLNGCKKLVLSETMDFSNASSVDGAFYQCTAIEKLPESFTCRNVTSIHQMCAGCKNLRTVSQELDLSGVQGGSSYIYEGCGAFAFDGCQLEKESALLVLNTIGAVKAEYREGHTFPLHVGIHVDHQNDEEVLTAIANAEEKGWTLTVQWNGMPTSGVTTTDLDEIWCKVTESENGDYTDENGNRCTLDWGHYVTDTTGYKLFFSLVEAEQYYKLTKQEE